MAKHLVFVVQVTVPDDPIGTEPVGKSLAEYVRSSLQEWAVRCRGAYASIIRIDEVVVGD